MPQDFYRRNKVKNVHQPLCIDYPMSPRESVSWVPKHISSILKSIKVFNPITTKSLGEKLNSSQQDREGKTPYDPTILTKPAIHQDREISRTRERERDQTHSYWYKPSTSRVSYSLLIVVAAGWWRWPPEMIPPFDRVPERGLDWFSVAREPCGSGTSDLG